MIMKMQRFQKQKGNAVLGILFVLAVLSFITLSYYKHLQWSNLQTQAHTLGNKISMVVDGLEKRLSFDESFSTGSYTLKDLKNKSCGGTADEDYLPCGFSLTSSINDGKITISVTQSKSNPDIKKASIFTDTIGILQANSTSYKPTAYLAGEVLAAAQSTKAFAGNQYLSASVSYKLDTKKSIVEANIIANQNNSNIFLRIDGSNKMQNSLQFNKELNKDHRMVKYLASITNDGEDIAIGNQSGIKGDSNVVVNDLTIHSMGDKKLTSLLNSMPVGAVLPFAGRTIPDGFFECNGASFSNSTYPKLYTALGKNIVPDLRGQFIRGWDHGAGVDSGRTFGSYQGDAIRDITGRFSHLNFGNNTGAFAEYVNQGGRTPVSGGSSSHGYTNFKASKVVPTAADNRPKNIALMYIIKHD
jgi:microcystin-dependent protein